MLTRIPPACLSPCPPPHSPRASPSFHVASLPEYVFSQDITAAGGQAGVRRAGGRSHGNDRTFAVCPSSGPTDRCPGQKTKIKLQQQSPHPLSPLLPLSPFALTVQPSLLLPYMLGTVQIALKVISKLILRFHMTSKYLSKFVFPKIDLDFNTSLSFLSSHHTAIYLNTLELALSITSLRVFTSQNQISPQCIAGSTCVPG